MLAAWLAFGEVPEALEIVGGALLLAGVATTLVRPRRRVPTAEPHPAEAAPSGAREVAARG